MQAIPVRRSAGTFSALWLLIAACAAAADAPPAKLPGPQAVLADAVAAWHMADEQSADGQSPLTVKGEAALGLELSQSEREASLARGGDGRAAEIHGGWLDAGQGGGGRLNLQGQAVTLLLRLRNPKNDWHTGELLCKHGGHDKVVYNLYAMVHDESAGDLGFEIGVEGRAGLGGSIRVPLAPLRDGKWHDVVARYDGQQVSLCLDGVLAGKSPASGSLRQGNREPLLIARRGFVGQIDHAAVWQRALSDDEVIAVSGGPEAMAARRAAEAQKIEAQIGREGLTLADQLRGARELRERLWADPFRPRYHLLPPDGSWNDINGAIWWKGRYHIFFLGRLAPDLETILSGRDTSHARETWLHASSRDLVHWIHHPPALVPVFDGSMPGGFYSGDAINDAPVPTLIYHVPGQGTCLATAEDDELIHWKPWPHNPVIPIPKEPADYVVFDPCGWYENGTYYALVGNKNKAPGYEGDCTSLFRSTDMVQWEYRGPFYKSDRKWTEEGEDLACPDFFPLGDKYMLLAHVHGPAFGCHYYLGRYENERFLPEQHGRMNWPGGQLSAPETLRDGQGRRLFWGWVREAAGAKHDGWASVASLPRVLSLGADGTLSIEPAPELEQLRFNARQREPLDVAADGVLDLDDVRGECLEIEAVFAPGPAREFGLAVRSTPDGAEQTPIVCVPGQQQLKIELAHSTLDEKISYPRWSKRRVPADADADEVVTEQVAPLALAPGEDLHLRIFLDRSVLEVFANGRQCLTQRIYPTRPDSLGVRLLARGGPVRVKSLRAWDLSPTNSW